MALFIKLLALLWTVNFLPPLVAQIFEQRGNRPLDGNRVFFDGRPVFGPHKTVRGVVAGVCAGFLTGLALGFPWWLGTGAGILSMAGDLFSSFLKRRLSFLSGDVVPGLDQTPEGIFPFLLLAPYFSLSPGCVFGCVLLFGIGAYFGSLFLNRVLLKKPFETYPRRVSAKTRLRELLSCQVIQSPYHHVLNFEDAVYYHVFMKSLFRLLGIYERGKRNALQVVKHAVTFDLPGLPPAFHGYTILFMSDLHLDGLDGLTENLAEIVRQTPVDLCILGGDIRMETHGPFSPALARLKSLLPHIRAKDGVVAVLGNHDCLEIVESLREHGISFLINDSRKMERQGETVWLVGLDDAHYFKAHDLDEAFSEVPKGGFAILISHTNEIYRQARKYGPNLFLCGHTHAGQIRIPLLGPLFTHSNAPRRMCQGKWNYKGMPGYTSGGAGVSGVPVRFNSKGEVTIIRLERKP